MLNEKMNNETTYDYEITDSIELIIKRFYFVVKRHNFDPNDMDEILNDLRLKLYKKLETVQGFRNKVVNFNKYNRYFMMIFENYTKDYNWKKYNREWRDYNVLVDTLKDENEANIFYINNGKINDKLYNIFFNYIQENTNHLTDKKISQIINSFVDFYNKIHSGKELADMYGISRATLYRNVNTGLNVLNNLLKEKFGEDYIQDYENNPTNKIYYEFVSYLRGVGEYEAD
ncbi:hypothetical protein ACKXGF_07450 [Alkalibacillus sp. S2W]|uniref:hypothetical protein n=1 Tax=Alkalibacillus sp. S2W TaxID=3386553 RepID=UPI00398D32B9